MSYFILGIHWLCGDKAMKAAFGKENMRPIYLFNENRDKFMEKRPACRIQTFLLRKKSAYPAIPEIEMIEKIGHNSNAYSRSRTFPQVGHQYFPSSSFTIVFL